MGHLTDDTTQDAWFAVNIAPVFVAGDVGVEITNALAADYLKPFGRRSDSTPEYAITDVYITLLKDGNAIGVLKPGDGAKLVIATPATLGEPLAGALTAEFDKPTSDPVARFSEDGAAHTTTISDAIEPASWKHYLTHASTYPSDIPFNAGLVFFVHLPRTLLQDANKILIAPVFNTLPFANPHLPNLTGANADVPDIQMLDKDLAPAANWDLTRWNYNYVYTPKAPQDTHDELELEWVQTHAPVHPADPWTSHDGIDERTQWIDPHIGQSDDWHQHTESRVASLFDLPLRLVEWAGVQLQQNPVTVTPDQAFGLAFAAALRDLAQPGFLYRPDGGRLLDDVVTGLVKAQSTTLTKDVLTQTLVDFSATNCANLNKWLTRLTDFFLTSGQFQESELGERLNPVWHIPVGDPRAFVNLLGRVRSFLLEQDTLRQFIAKEWQDAILFKFPDAVEWKKLSTPLNSILSDMDLPAVMRLGFSGDMWRTQTDDWYALAKITAKLQTALVSVFDQRFNAVSTTDYGKLLPHSDYTANRNSIETFLKASVDNWNTSALGPNPAPENPPDYSQGNQGIRVEFASPASANIADDVAGKYRGAALMLRQIGLPWCILNLAQYTVRTEEYLGAGIPVRDDVNMLLPPPFRADRVGVVPWQFLYRNGFRQISCTYRNQPLSARSPSARFSRIRYVQSLSENGNTPGAEGIYELWNAYRKAGAHRLPRLAFGKQYEAAAFAIGLGGELPTELCKADQPWRLKDDPNNWTNPPAGKTKSGLPYLRTVPIGLVRVEGTEPRGKAEMVKLAVPAIPDKVFPIAGSLQAKKEAAQSPAPSGATGLLALAENGDLNGQAPLILLCDPAFQNWNTVRANYKFHIRPPATDLSTWDSWPWDNAAANPLNLQPDFATRRDLYSRFAQNSDLPNDGTKSIADDLTLDDPAATGFQVTLIREYVPASLTLQDPPPATPFKVRTLPLNPYVSAAALVEIIVASPGDNPTIQVPALDTDPYQVTVKVPAGCVYRLEITPVVTTGAADLFLKTAKPRPLTEPRVLRIEVATQLKQPALSKYPNALNAALKPALLAGQLNVDFDLAVLQASAPDLAPLIHRIEVDIQQWRWQGRPLARLDTAIPLPPWSAAKHFNTGDRIQAPVNGVTFNFQAMNGGTSGALPPSFPAGLNITVQDNDISWRNDTATVFEFPFDAAQANGPDQVLEPFDGLYFGERAPYDFLPVSAQVDAIASAAALKPVMLHQRDLSRALQAAYYRFAVLAWSRYEGLINTDASIDSRYTGQAGAAEQWKRCVVKCRQTKAAQPPAVRMIVPLTRTADAATQTPGLLVVLDEPWFEWGGLAETFSAHIVSVAQPEPADGSVTRPEAGPDPVVYNPKSDPLEDQTALLKLLNADLAIEGPIGYTFDTNTAAPLFERASFVVPAPAATLDMAWWFLKIQFARGANPAGTEGDVSGLRSPSTLPAYVQLLPAANLWTVAGEGPRDCKTFGFQVAPDNIGLSLVMCDAAAQSDIAVLASGRPAHAGDQAWSDQFEIWVLCTRRVIDAFGHTDQEAFVDLIPLSKLQLNPANPKPDLVRLVEVQRVARSLFVTTDGPLPVESTSWQDLAEDLFPQEKDKKKKTYVTDPAAARARIVRVSPPIGSAANLACA